MKKILSLFFVAFFSVSMWGTTWTVAGTEAVFGTSFDPTDTNNDMTLVDGLYKWEKMNVEVVSSFQFKVCADHAWGIAYPGSDYVWNAPTYTKCKYDITITFNESTHDINVIATPHLATIYFVNTASWADNTVKAYVWRGTDDSYKGWSGEVMTKTGETTVNGYPTYSYTFPDIYTKVIFSSNGASDAKTGDLTLEADKYYSYNMGRWYASKDDVPKFHIILNSNISGDWADADGPFEESVSAESVSYTVKGLTASTEYRFGVKISGTWNRTMEDITSTHTSSYLTKADGNMAITTAAAGDYVFTYTYASNLLTVTYPDGGATALDETIDSKKAVKRIVNGQLVIEREGKMYNALGAEVK